MNQPRQMRMHYCLALIMLSLVSTSAMSQSDYRTDKWRFSDPKPFGFTVLDLQFFDNNLGIAVGNNGGIARTTNGGAKWSYGPFTFTSPAGLTTNGTFSDVHIASATVAYAVGSNGMMAKSTNAGQNWTFVNTPLYANSKAINTCWFLNKDTGYIAGQFNTPDSFPKIYFTRNGGTTWDSIGAPASNGTTKVGYVSNTTYAPIDYPIDAKAKEIYRIQFINDSVAYINGSGSPLFPSLPQFNITSATTCALTTSLLTTGSQSASLLWKMTKHVITDYSLSKERLGYTGNPATPFTCISKYGTVTPAGQTFRALGVINDSLVVMMSFNNNVVVKVRTGKNDSTLNINKPGAYEKGVYEVLNTANAPVGYSNIPLTQVLLASNPYQIRKASNGKLYAAANFGALWTSVDTGRNWVRESSLPQGRNYSAFATWAFDFLPSGKLITMGQGGVVADSTPGGSFNSSYVFVGSNGNKVDFVDCNNGIVTGGGSIAVTTDGGASWTNKDRADFINSFYNISGFNYTQLNRAYFAVSNGTLYRSVDQATTLDPIFSDFNYQMNDVVGKGNDTIYAVGYASVLPTASRKSSFFRSTNSGTTWQTIDIAVTTTTPAFTAPTINRMAFPSRLIGYVSGSRNAVYKTNDGGTTWTDISPFPTLNFGPAGFPNTTVTYTSICALDDNTVFVVGNMFTNVGVRRIYKTIDGGVTWTDITSNLPVLLPSGNMLSIIFSDANNGYVAGSNVLFVTSDGGATWKMEVAPHGNLNNAIGFAPRTVPAGIPFVNRKLFVAGIAFASGTPSIMEYGDTLNVNVNATQAITNATCTNLSGGSITVNATGGLSPYTYSINGGAFQAGSTFTGLTQGAKTIIIKDNFCGTVTRTVNVGFTDNLTLTTTPATDTSVCAGAPVPLVATSTATTYAWTPSTGLSSASVSNPIATVNSSAAYTLTATLNGCVKTKTINVSIKPNPVISAGPDKTIVDGDQVILEGSANNVATLAWTPATGLTGANTLTPFAKPTTTTTYTLTVKNTDGCTSTDNAVVSVIPYCLKVMEAFTPNGDGMNDKWLVTAGGACTSNVSVTVFNRYGNTVYKNDHYQNNWDGQYNDKSLPDGTYYYSILYTLINGNMVSLKGNVTILR
jgi:gliding motility-associated-like protein